MVFKEERAGPILDARGCLASTQALLQSLRPDPIHRPGRDAASGKAGVYPARKFLIASPFARLLAANGFSVRLNGVSPSRPKVSKAPRAVAVNAGRKATAAGGAVRGVDGCEHGAIVEQPGPLMPRQLCRRRSWCHLPACGAGSPQAFWQAQLLPSACLRAWRASPPSSSRRHP
jgi:hypothetical protein